jgi:xylose isomerase
MDTYALAFKTARRIIADGKLDGFLADRYSSYDSGVGKSIEKGTVGFAELEKLVLTKLGEPSLRSGRQEYLENLLNTYLTGG